MSPTRPSSRLRDRRDGADASAVAPPRRVGPDTGTLAPASAAPDR